MRAAWAAAHRPVADVPRWVVLVVWTIQLCVLPSSIWRILVVTFHLPIFSVEAGSGDLPAWFPIELYVVVLSLVSEALAFTAFGLVARWGEVWPRWVPWLRGRPVRPLAAVVPAALGSLGLVCLWTWAAVMLLLGRHVTGEPANDSSMSFETWQGTIFMLAYLPLMLWGPLLTVVTVHYHRRRRRAGRLRAAAA